MCSLADLAGPQRRGILPSVPPSLRKAAHSVLDDFLQPQSLDIWLPYLQDASFHPLLCTTIANSIRTSPHRSAICEWMPPAERTKASKGKRGWEKRATSITSPTAASLTPFSPGVPTQSWVLPQLLRSITVQGNNSPKVAVSLEALAALCQDNPMACSFLRTDHSVSFSPVAGEGSAGYMQSLLLLQRSSSPDVRIAVNEL